MTRRPRGDDEPARGGAPRPLAAGLSAALDRPGWAGRLEGAKVHDRWREIAGEQLALHVEPVRLAGGILVVRAESSTWATQVRYLSGELARRANEVLGEGQVSQVTVVVGSDQARGPNSRPR